MFVFLEDAMPDTTDAIRIYSFPPAFGLPTTGPFTLKLLMALRMAGLPYQLCPGELQKGPKRKIPWIEVGTTVMADSALILRWLEETRDVDFECGLTPLERAHGLALRILLEEHWHQVFEVELILHPAGAGARLGASMQEHFRGHLYERGMLRHTPEEITAFGKQDLDAVAAWLDGRTWAIADRPTVTDCSLWGLLAPAIFAPFATPCMSYARTLVPIVSFIERTRAQFFPELAPAPSASGA
jgi:glutathione S-transferase